MLFHLLVSDPLQNTDSVDDDYTATTTSTECPSDAYATGATFLDTGNFVLAIQLECAPVTSTCAPSVVVASDTDDGVDGYGGVTATDDSDDSDGLLGGYADDDDDYTYVVPDDDDGDGTLIDTQGTFTRLFQTGEVRSKTT